MNEKKRVIQQFGKHAANYVTSKTHAKGEDLQKVIEIVATQESSGELLDIATGGGHVANALAPYFKQVVALDLTPEMLEKAKGFIESNGIRNAAFVQGDAENLPFPDESVGTVTCRIAAHHFGNPDSFLNEVNRVLKDKGLFIFVDNVAPEIQAFDEFYNQVEKKRDPSHVRAYKKSEWISKFERTGFYVEELVTFKKKFIFDTWCQMMDVSEEEKHELNTMMGSAPRELIDYFSIVVHNNQVQSFQGQSVLMAVRKR
ncbi:Methyltransferase domain-containing protein [Mesobacillus persicus]|uniref:Methyltransferase domain-containing protein n=1 Tax=Mesobacillus persicus TaxID=930146 RepID=A0A1H7VY17_9BACI|nr:class I SAM-dependent methyltransferase [Mesobacillus persicus]SEM14232.1 Methyltransferase domain-containing protein [Mesobacillus persicus]